MGQWVGGPNLSTPPGIAEYGNQEDIKTKSGSNTLVRMPVSLTHSKKRARQQKEQEEEQEWVYIFYIVNRMYQHF